MLLEPAVESAMRILGAAHTQVTVNQYGRYVEAGFSVAPGISSSARITHATPDPDLLDLDRTSDDDLAAERHQMIDAYADTLVAAGWSVEKRALQSRRPFLIARPA